MFEGIPLRTSHPMDGSIHIISPAENSIFGLNLRCYNLNNGNDTEITFANSALRRDDYSFAAFDVYSEASFTEFPVQLNGNVTCRSPSTGQEITVFIASKLVIIFMYTHAIHIYDQVCKAPHISTFLEFQFITFSLSTKVSALRGTFVVTAL